MDQKYVQFAKAVEAQMKADNGPEFCHDAKLAKAAYAMGLSVQEAATLIADELRPQIEAQQNAIKAGFMTLRRVVVRAASV